MKEEVYHLLKTVPKGYVVTYGQIAARLGKPRSARAVGNILHRNPDPIGCPCYRVVNFRGELARHFGDGGIDVQKQRLEADGIAVSDYRVDLEKYLYREL